MPPLSITEQISPMVQIPDHFNKEQCKICSENHVTEDHEGNERLQKKRDYEIMLPKNELKLMAPIREWEQRMGFLTPLRWSNIILISLFHLVPVIWWPILLWHGDYPALNTYIFSYIWGYISGFGVTAGVHRYYCHRSFKAKWPLQVILLTCYSMSGQNTVYEWVRDHRVHHKYSESMADPHNANRGFFFAHVGWLMMKKHPEVVRRGKNMDMSDIENDPLVQFYTKHFMLIKFLLAMFIPFLIPMIWGESIQYCILGAWIRYVCSVNGTWSVNSFAHLWGNKPFDLSIMPAENVGVSIVALGEGWHNYHHTFPWDYKAAELPYFVNPTTMILDLFAKIGWAYEMKKASPCLIKSIAERKGEPAKVK